MKFKYHAARRARIVVPVMSVAGASVAAIVGVCHPAAAAAVLAAVTSAVTCAATGTSACVSGTNSSSGIGVLGASNTGTGVRGTANTNFGVKGSSGTYYGIYGTTTSGPAGIYGSSTSGAAGVAGTTANGYGVYGYTTGSSGTSAGVYGSSANGYGVSGNSVNGSAGVIGTSALIGVYGNATSGGTGVEGKSAQGYGLYGTTMNGNSDGVFGFESGAGPGVVGESGKGAGLVGFSYGSTQPAVYGENYSGGFGGEFSSSYEAVVAQSGEFPLIAQNGSGQVVFDVDYAGDVNYSGGIYQFSLTSRGTTARSFTAKMTQPTVEDTGTAQLISGAAAVRLDPTFAASIDPRVAYRIFLTPDGDTPHGLYVATKSPAGFTVREAQGGRSTVSFDYRIVATSLGQAGQRMGMAAISAVPAGRPLSQPKPKPLELPTIRP